MIPGTQCATHLGVTQKLIVKEQWTYTKDYWESCDRDHATN